MFRRRQLLTLGLAGLGTALLAPAIRTIASGQGLRVIVVGAGLGRLWKTQGIRARIGA